MKALIEIFWSFFRVGALTFGGGYSMLPMLQKEFSSKPGNITNEDIIDYYAIAQCLPGIIAVNTAMLIGHKQKKSAGMITAGIGMAMPSIIIILIIASFINNFTGLEAVAHGFNGIRVAVAVLILNAAIKMWKSGVKDKTGIIIFIAALAALTFLDISPILPVLAGAICGVVIKERGAKA
ncbi:MAG: chromate transporter [Clostridiales bacterium]|nr:chromate transporter [Clostridiales bacterium]